MTLGFDLTIFCQQNNKMKDNIKQQVQEITVNKIYITFVSFFNKMQIKNWQSVQKFHQFDPSQYSHSKQGLFCRWKYGWNFLIIRLYCFIQLPLSLEVCFQRKQTSLHSISLWPYDYKNLDLGKWWLTHLLFTRFWYGQQLNQVVWILTSGFREAEAD